MSEQKKMIELEYMLNTPPVILYNRLSTPGGLSEWFADSVTAEGKVYSFIWSGIEEKAELTLRKENKMVRFQWLEENEGNTWFEFHINVDELTGDVALIIIDNIEEDEEKDTIDLWNKQIESLKRGLGSL